MLTLKIAIKRKEKLTDGTVNVKIAVIFDRKTRYIKTDYHILPRDFNRLDEEIRASLAIKIASLYNKVRNIPYTDINSLMRLLRDKHSSVDLVALLDNYIENCRNVNYRKSLGDTLSLLRRYGVSTDFAHIDKAWLLSLHKQMTEHGLKPNSVGVHFRNIRTILNEAFTMGYTRQYPFRGYKIPRERTCKRNLTTDQMRIIMGLQLSGRDQWSRDMFLLSFYLLGMNLRDMAYLKEIRDGRIEYIRSKGKKHYSVRIFPEAMRIISKYKGKRYLLDIMDRYVDYRNAVKYINIDLKKILPGLSTYAARHSVASIMSSEGVSHDVIARALGHSVDNQMTAIYINYDERRTDEAHRRMIDALLPLKASVPLPQFFN